MVPRQNGIGQWESGAARAHSKAARRPHPLCAKRRGVRRDSAALDMKQTPAPF
jgi:hypothetical protein